MPCVTSSSRPDNVVVASFCFGKYTTTRALWQWDYGIILTLDGLELPNSYQVHFANSDSAAVAKIEIGDADGVEIPRAYLMTGLPIYAWVYLNTGDSDGETVYQITIPVQPRPKPEEFEPTPEEQSLIDQILAALNAAVEQTAEDVEAADLSAQEAAAQADRAEEAQEAAEAAQTAAETAERNAALSATAAGESEAAARTYAQNAARSESNAEGYAEDALESANLADERSRDAADSADEAEAAKNAVLNMNATATTLPEGSTATVTKTTDQQGAVTLAFGIPRGATGATGPQGEDGRGIASITKTSTSGLVDTYTVTYTDGTTWTYQVNNGEKGDPGEGVAPGGTTGQMLVKATDTDYDTEWVDPPEGDVTQEEFDALQTYVEDMSPVVTAGPSAIVSVDDAAPLKAEEIEIAIEPVQDLHGYDNPWPAGGGKNLVNIPTTTITGVEGNTGNISCNIPAGTYTFAVTTSTAVAWILRLRDANNVAIITPASQAAIQGRQSVTFTLPETAYIANVYFNGATVATDFQIEAGSTATDYAPYSNICPISGWTGANVEARGKNLFGGLELAQKIVALVPNATIDTQAKTVKYAASNVARKVIFDHFKENTQYTIILSAQTTYSNLIIKYTDGRYDTVKTDRVTVSTANKTIATISGQWASGDTILNYEECGIFEGVLTSDDFVPYIGSTTPISWADEAGTVYGGTLEWEKDGTVSVVVDRVSVTVPANATSFASLTNTVRFKIDNLFYSNWYKLGNADIVSNMLVRNGYTTDAPAYSHGDNSANVYIKLPKSLGLTNQTEINAWLTNNPIQFVYPLATPVTYTLTPTEALTLLRGSNNLWADTGDTTLTYRQDVAVLLKKLTSQVAALNTAVANT